MLCASGGVLVYILTIRIVKKLFNFWVAFWLFSACTAGESAHSTFVEGQVTHLKDNVKLRMPPSGGIQIWIKGRKVFEDTAHIFEAGRWPRGGKLANGQYEISLQQFDAPDLDKTHNFYFYDGRLVKEQILPYFEQQGADIDKDGRLEFWGILHLIDGYNASGMCYYNPTLFYEESANGLRLDSVLTIAQNREIWGRFFGFEQQFIKLRCPRRP